MASWIRPHRALQLRYVAAGALLFALPMLIAVASSHAASYPARPVRIIVPGAGVA
jgi:tripartite-type tricarboxylate transporter receptor subunit TctC